MVPDVAKSTKVCRVLSSWQGFPNFSMPCSPQNSVSFWLGDPSPKISQETPTFGTLTLFFPVLQRATLKEKQRHPHVDPHQRSFRQFRDPSLTYMHVFWNVDGSQRTWREPTQAHGENAKLDTEKPESWNRTHNLLDLF